MFGVFVTLANIIKNDVWYYFNSSLSLPENMIAYASKPIHYYRLFWILFIKYHIFAGLCTKLLCIKLYFVILNIIISLLLQYSDTIDVHKRLTTEGIQRGLATIHCYDNGTSFLGTGRSHGTCNSSRLLTTKIYKIYIFCC